MVETKATGGHEALNLVNGKKRSTDDHFEIRNPAAFDQVVGLAHVAPGALLEEAVAGATEAQGEWGRTPLDERLEQLLEGEAELVSMAGEMQWESLLTQEQGKVMAESAMEIVLACGLIGSLAELAPEALEDEVLEDVVGRRICVYDPLGVTGVITPWNWPVVLSLVKVIPALMAGNAVIVKPAVNTPLVVTEILSVLSSHLPEGTLNVVQGGAAVGSALVAHPDVPRISFTGSIATGKSVYAGAASEVKRISLELGGNDPAVVLPDVDLSESTIRAMLDAMFMTAGQVCMAIKRLYVDESRYDELVEALVETGRGITVGDGLLPSVNMGPLNNRMQFERVTKLCADAESRGAVLTPTGQSDADTAWQHGYFMLPAFATNVDDSFDLVSEEQFGPIVPIMAFSDIDEAVQRANATEYGLCSSVWSDDEDRAFEIARQIHSGIGFVNQHGFAGIDFMLPAGGLKHSGLGREGGIEGMRGFTTERYITSR